MNKHQQFAFEAPMLRFEQGQDAGYWHEERGTGFSGPRFRVGVHVNATGNPQPDGKGGTIIREPWPFWVVTAVLGERRVDRRGIETLGPATPLMQWSWPERRRAGRIIAANLAEVGAARTQEIPAATWLLAEHAKTGRPAHELCALSGWRRMTMDEAWRCFTEYPEVRARINRTWGLLDRDGGSLSGAGPDDPGAA